MERLWKEDGKSCSILLSPRGLGLSRQGCPMSRGLMGLELRKVFSVGDGNLDKLPEKGVKSEECGGVTQEGVGSCSRFQALARKT